MLLAESEVEQSIGINLEKILKNPHSKYDILLKEGDVLNIPKELQTVTLSGAFLYPISVRYDKSFGFRKYASMAGGFADEAKRSKAFVVYANGSVDKTTSFLGIKFYPKIEPGAEIIVPKKPEIKNKMTLQESIGLATAITSVITGIVTVRILTK
jgi:protein involved in polysaccharide export with SLBB domain